MPSYSPFLCKKESTARPQWCVRLGLYSRCLSTGHSEKGTLLLLSLLAMGSSLGQAIRVGVSPSPLVNRPEGCKDGAMWEMGQTEEPLPRLAKAGESTPNMFASEMQWVWVTAVGEEVRELLGIQTSHVCAPKSRVPPWRPAFMMSEMENQWRVQDNGLTRSDIFFTGSLCLLCWDRLLS